MITRVYNPRANFYSIMVPKIYDTSGTCLSMSIARLCRGSFFNYRKSKAISIFYKYNFSRCSEELADYLVQGSRNQKLASFLFLRCTEILKLLININFLYLLSSLNLNTFKYKRPIAFYYFALNDFHFSKNMNHSMRESPQFFIVILL